MDTAPAAAMPVLDGTMGMLLVGVLLAATLFGVTCTQTFTYYTNCAGDQLYLKVLVTVTFVLDMTHQGLIAHSIYYYLVSHYGNPNALLVITPTIVIEIMVTALVALLVQAFFLWRIWWLSTKNIYIIVPIALCALAGFMSSVVYTYHAFRLPSFAALPEIETESILINAFGAVTDVLIAGVMVFLLHRSRTAVQRTNNVIDRLTTFVVSTGLITSVCAIASLIAVLAAPDLFVHICFFFMLGRLYANSLLATLNARGKFRGELQSASTGTGSLSWNIASRGAGATSRAFTIRSLFKDPAATTLSVRMDTSMTTREDADGAEPDNVKLGDLRAHERTEYEV